MKHVWPIVERELRVAARRPATWRTRWLVSGLAVAGTGLMVFSLKRLPPGQLGGAIFLELALLTGWVALCLGPALTADCISRERREGTLGLLFLTDLGGWDVVLGKLAAAAWNAGYGLLGLVPVLALPVLLGGVTLGQVGLLVVALLNALFVSLAAGMLASSFCREARQAAMLAFSAVIGWMAIPWAVFVWLDSREPAGNAAASASVLLASPFLPFVHVGISSLTAMSRGGAFLGVPLGLVSLPFRAQALAFTGAVVGQQLCGWLMLGIVARRVRTVWQDKADSSPRGWQAQWVQFHYGDSVRRAAVRHRLLGQNPFLWLSLREVWKPLYPWLLLLGLAGALLTGAMEAGLREVMDFAPFLLVVAHVLFAVWVVGEAAQRLCEERHSGALELLLTTPLEERGILQGQGLGLRRLFLGPLLVLLLLDTWQLWRGADGPFSWLGPAPNVLLGMVCYVRSLFAVRWLATRLALRGFAINSVVTAALGLGALLPWILAHVVPATLEWSLGALGWQALEMQLLPARDWISFVICLGWLETVRQLSQRHVRRNFRELVSRPLRGETKTAPGSGLRRGR